MAASRVPQLSIRRRISSDVCFHIYPSPRTSSSPSPAPNNTTPPAPVALLFGWLGSTFSQLRHYAYVFNHILGYNVVVTIAPPHIVFALRQDTQREFLRTVLAFIENDRQDQDGTSDGLDTQDDWRKYVAVPKTEALEQMDPDFQNIGNSNRNSNSTGTRFGDGTSTKILTQNHIHLAIFTDMDMESNPTQGSQTGYPPIHPPDQSNTNTNTDIYSTHIPHQINRINYTTKTCNPSDTGYPIYQVDFNKTSSSETGHQIHQIHQINHQNNNPNTNTTTSNLSLGLRQACNQGVILMAFSNGGAYFINHLLQWIDQPNSVDNISSNQPDKGLVGEQEADTDADAAFWKRRIAALIYDSAPVHDTYEGGLKAFTIAMAAANTKPHPSVTEKCPDSAYSSNSTPHSKSQPNSSVDSRNATPDTSSLPWNIKLRLSLLHLIRSISGYYQNNLVEQLFRRRVMFPELYIYSDADIHVDDGHHTRVLQRMSLQQPHHSNNSQSPQPQKDEKESLLSRSHILDPVPFVTLLRVPDAPHVSILQTHRNKYITALLDLNDRALNPWRIAHKLPPWNPNQTETVNRSKL